MPSKHIKPKSKKNKTQINNDETNEDIYQIEYIKNKKWFSKTKEYKYLIKWVVFPENESTWKPIENLLSIPDELAQYDKLWEK